jgi:outer membrane protein OmpA-like peptidoglycan-associated protein
MAYRSGTFCASILTLVLAGACGGPPPGMPAPDAAASSNKDCVVLAEGLYEFRSGQLLAVSADRVNLSQPTGMEGEIATALAAQGFPWAGLKLRGRVATLTGTAPSAEAKAAALAAGEAAITDQPQSGSGDLIIVDGISVDGGERGVGESLAELADSGATLGTCQRAFTSTMSGRNLQFESGNARISPVSARLLDAITGVAVLCETFVVEIGGHTDSRGADDYNRQLSQDRADAVRNYLVSKGVPEDNLVSVGYGETQPLDPAPTPEAYDRNRRTEFKVIAR